MQSMDGKKPLRIRAIQRRYDDANWRDADILAFIPSALVIAA
jgi:hypothetical protein